MKKNPKDQYPDQDEVDNPFSFAIQEETIPTKLKIHREMYDEMIDPHDHISFF